MTPELQNYADKALQALSALKKAALEESGYNNGQEDLDAADFKLVWESGMSAEELAAEAEEAAGELASTLAVVHTGHVYCYSCHSAACVHAAPSEPGQVFIGYASTGKPRWDELFNFLLFLGDERTDQLFDRQPEVLVRLVNRKQLNAEQLISFGKNSFTYRIWCELVAGYIRAADLRAALTVQIVETRDHKLYLQIIADSRLREALANAPEDQRSSLYRLHDALGEAQRRIASLGNLWQNTKSKERRKKLRPKVYDVLRHLAHSIERKGRQYRRRTIHAEVRSRERRPVHKAHDDLLQASGADFFRDTVRNSFIVAGKAGRMHVYSDEGKHITTLIFKGDELARRVRRKRYVPMEPAAVQELRDSAAASPDSKF